MTSRCCSRCGVLPCPPYDGWPLTILNYQRAIAEVSPFALGSLSESTSCTMLRIK